MHAGNNQVFKYYIITLLKGNSVSSLFIVSQVHTECPLWKHRLDTVRLIDYIGQFIW